MKKLLVIVIAFLCTSFSGGVNTHPIKLTSSLIKYDASAKSIHIQCKVFIDDFSPAISETLFDNILNSAIPKSEIEQIEDYFNEKYKIKVNGKIFLWKIDSYDISLRENVLTLEASHSDIALKKGDKITIENALLFEVFGDIQSNWMTLRFPPFLKNYNFESNTGDSVYLYTF